MRVLSMTRAQFDREVQACPDLEEGEDFELRQVTSQVVEIVPKSLLGELFLSVLYNAA